MSNTLTWYPTHCPSSLSNPTSLLYLTRHSLTDEIPQGLQLIANGAGHTLLLNGRKPVQKRVIISSIFRLIVGYLFLSSLFINIAQNSDVIEIFYDVLALEFVENIGKKQLVKVSNTIWTEILT